MDVDELVPIDPLTEIEIVSLRVAELDFISLADVVMRADDVIIIDGIVEQLAVLDTICIPNETSNDAR